MPSITHDSEVDALYLLISNQEIAETVALTDHVDLDLASDGSLVGIEVLGLSPEGTSPE